MLRCLTTARRRTWILGPSSSPSLGSGSSSLSRVRMMTIKSSFSSLDATVADPISLALDKRPTIAAPPQLASPPLTPAAATAAATTSAAAGATTDGAERSCCDSYSSCCRNSSCSCDDHEYFSSMSISPRRTTTRPTSTAHGLLGAPTRVLHNFFPFGRKRGPKMLQKVLPRNNFDRQSMLAMKPRRNAEARTSNAKQRNRLQLHCRHCRFEWVQDALMVRCTAQPQAHAQREKWLHPMWLWYNKNPHNFHKYMPVAVHPRTGWFINREDTNTHGNQHRAAGLNTKTLRLEKERRGIARGVSHVGSFSQHWKTKFPYPT